MANWNYRSTRHLAYLDLRSSGIIPLFISAFNNTESFGNFTIHQPPNHWTTIKQNANPPQACLLLNCSLDLDFFHIYKNPRISFIPVHSLIPNINVIHSFFVVRSRVYRYRSLLGLGLPLCVRDASSGAFDVIVNLWKTDNNFYLHPPETRWAEGGNESDWTSASADAGVNLCHVPLSSTRQGIKYVCISVRWRTPNNKDVLSQE